MNGKRTYQARPKSETDRIVDTAINQIKAAWAKLIVTGALKGKTYQSFTQSLVTNKIIDKLVDNRLYIKEQRPNALAYTTKPFWYGLKAIETENGLELTIDGKSQGYMSTKLGTTHKDFNFYCQGILNFIAKEHDVKTKYTDNKYLQAFGDIDKLLSSSQEEDKEEDSDVEVVEPPQKRVKHAEELHLNRLKAVALGIFPDSATMEELEQRIASGEPDAKAAMIQEAKDELAQLGNNVAEEGGANVVL